MGNIVFFMNDIFVLFIYLFFLNNDEFLERVFRILFLEKDF